MNRIAHLPKCSFLASSAILVLALGLSGCSKLSSANRHLEKADKYFEAGSLSEAEIEYKNVLQADHVNARAIIGLGKLYVAEGTPQKALPYLTKGRELQSDNTELRIKIGQISLERGDLKDAREQAISVLGQNPKDKDAPLLLAESSIKPAEIEDARERLKALALKPEERAPMLVGIGFLALRGGNITQAQDSFSRALVLDPNSSASEFGLGTIYFQRKDLAQADKAFSEAYRLAPPRSQMRLKYAQFKLATSDADGARRVLEEIIHSTPDYVPSMVLLAEIEMAQKHLPEASSLVDKVLQKDSVNLDALILGARIKLAQGDTEKGISELERMQSLYPKYPPIRYLLGQGYLAEGDVPKAISSLSEAVALNPNLPEPALLLAATNLRKGDFRAASAALSRLVRTRPVLYQAQLLQAEVLRGEGDFDGALDIYKALAKSRPEDPQIPLFTGMTVLQQNKKDEARRSFESALAISPSYFPAVEQLVNLDILEKKFPSAIQRTNSQIEKNPKSEVPRLLLARIYLAQNDQESAETALLKTIDLNPDVPTAYFMLAQLYAATSRQDEALANLQKIVAKNPKTVGALMMIGIIYDSQKNYPSAKEAYEKVLTVSPKFGPALNNLAFLYSEKFNDQEKGFELAQRAREIQPGDPHIADTLGWIVYKRRQYPWALSLLRESAAKLPTEATVQFHLGMALYTMGSEAAAKEALQHALQINPAFADAAETKKRLSILAINAADVPERARDSVEKSLTGFNEDPIALERLAKLHESEGLADKAVTESQTALKLNPSNVPVMIELIHLYNLKQETGKAMELAKELHRLDPNDPDVSRTLGLLAYKTGDFQWAYNLLQETAHANPEDANAQFDLGRAAYAIGQLSESEEAMRQSLKGRISGEKADEARRFLEMKTMVDNSAWSDSATHSVESILKADPDYVPGLMARASAYEAAHNLAAATQDYQKILEEFPDFPPAKRRLAVLTYEDATKDPATLILVMKARDAYPEDAEVEKVLGILVYRQKDYERAASLLKDAAQKRNKDAELYFYLGMAQHQLRDGPAAAKSLRRALDLGLPGDQTEEARKNLLPGV